MKQLFAILLITVMVGCSSDDSSNDNNPDNGGGQNTALNLKKLTTANSLTNYTSISYFNEDGTVQRRLGYTNGQNEEDSAYESYEYNSNLNLVSIKFYDADGQFDRDWRLFSYDAQGRLTTITNYGDGSHPPYITNFTYQGNQIDFSEDQTGRSGYVRFDNNGRIIETAHDTQGPGSYIYHTFTYEDGKVIEITDTHSSGNVYNYTVDSNVNPMYRDFTDRPMQYMILDQYLYDIDFTFTHSYLQNNPTNITVTQNNMVSDHEVTNYIYNDNNYPTSSSTTRYNSNITRTYEYY